MLGTVTPDGDRRAVRYCGHRNWRTWREITQVAETGPYREIEMMCASLDRPVSDGFDARLPGFDLVTRGIADLTRDMQTVESLLVYIGAPRLRTLGVAVPSSFDAAETRLFAMLTQQYADGAHSRYNALVWRLVSFERAAACVSKRPARASRRS